MKITINKDKLEVERIRAALDENDRYCPCKITKIPENRCICKDFLDKEDNGWCHCGLYYKEI